MPESRQARSPARPGFHQDDRRKYRAKHRTCDLALGGAGVDKAMIDWRNKPLPDLPSALIRLGLKDLAAVEEKSEYKVDMNIWHEPTADCSVCVVCFAGAVMAQSFATPINRMITPGLFEAPTRRKLSALESLRRGGIKDALEHLEISDPRIIPDILIPAYDASRPRCFHDAMADLACYLESLGL